MRVTGVIAEYNPFHTGHQYHLKKAKECSGADFLIVVMSPDFVQRGEPAIFDKYTRTRMALLSGADLVLELPVCYATGSAEYFAEGAVALLDRLGVTDTLCFGGESDDAFLFSRLAGILCDEPADFKKQLQRELKQGRTFPQARSAALADYLGRPDSLFSFLSSPNNILGVEYCKALQKTGSSISPLPIRREGSAYSSVSLEGPYCSATALRRGILQEFGRDPWDGNSWKSAAGPQEGISHLLSYIPSECRALFLEVCGNFMTAEELLPFLWQKLLSDTQFDSIFDISPDLSDRIRSLRYDCVGKTWTETVSLLKTRQFTEARIRRALLHLILNLPARSVEQFRQEGLVFYARILGFRKETAPLLHQIKKNSRIPLISKPAAASRLSGCGAEMWRQDVYASHLYRSVSASRAGTPFIPEYRISPIMLP